MNKCKQCGKDTENPKFCNRSCSATYNNKGIRRHGAARHCKICKICGSKTANSKYCSRKCMGKSRKEDVRKRIKNGEYKLTWSGNAILKDFFVEERDYQCERCKLSKWLSLPIPLNIHHKDGDASNNHPSNVELLCLNCHGLTDNFGRRNSESSRTYRYADVV